MKTPIISPNIEPLLQQTEYKFNPLDYGFRKVNARKSTKPLADFLAKGSFVKITAGDKDCFWYMATAPRVYYDYKNGRDDRWEFVSGSFSPTNYLVRPDQYYQTHVRYCGCITSHEFAQMLIIHSLGTTTNQGVIEYGKQRFVQDL